MPLREGRPFHKLQHHGATAACLFDTVDRGNVRLIEGGKDLGLPLEALHPLAVARERLRQHLDRDLALQLRVRRPIDLPHAPGAERAPDLVRTEAGSGGQCHLVLSQKVYSDNTFSFHKPCHRRGLRLSDQDPTSFTRLPLGKSAPTRSGCDREIVVTSDDADTRA
jgi:hypothetical protein